MLKNNRLSKFASKIFLAGALTFVTAGYTSCATADAATDQYVYICTGPKSKVYHSTPECSGLNRCSGIVKKVLKSSVKRRGCKKCT